MKNLGKILTGLEAETIGVSQHCFEQTRMCGHLNYKMETESVPRMNCLSFWKMLMLLAKSMHFSICHSPLYCVYLLYKVITSIIWVELTSL